MKKLPENINQLIVAIDYLLDNHCANLSEWELMFSTSLQPFFALQTIKRLAPLRSSFRMPPKWFGRLNFSPKPRMPRSDFNQLTRSDALESARNYAKEGK